MRTTRLAAIDLGTNTVKLLVGDSDGLTITPIHQASIQTRLGAGLQENRTLSQASIDHTLASVQSFLAIAKELEVEHVVANATSAVRDALNGPAFAKSFREATGLQLHIITGKEEADLVFRGIRSGPTTQSEHQIIIDVGGGSTEIIVASRERVQVQESFDVGSVRLLETASLTDPLTPNQRDAFSTRLTTSYESLIKTVSSKEHWSSVPALIAAGGGAVAASMLLNTMTQFDPQAIEAQPLSLEDLRHLDTRLWQTELEERRSWPGMPRDRADIVPIGVAIFVHLMEAFDLPQLWVSTRGLRFGLLLKHCHSVQIALNEGQSASTTQGP